MVPHSKYMKKIYNSYLIRYNVLSMLGQVVKKKIEYIYILSFFLAFNAVILNMLGNKEIAKG